MRQRYGPTTSGAAGYHSRNPDALLHDEAHLFDGLTEGARLTTEALFSSRPHLVIDASHVTTLSHEGLRVVPIAEVFSNPEAVFLGFGFPNVFLAMPPRHGESGWQRFAAFMFWRQAAYVADTKGRLQGGVFIELRGLSPEAREGLRTAMEARVGLRSISCANAVGKVLSDAGITCRKRRLSSKVRPMSLAEAIWEGGLEYRGTPIELRVIRTSAGTVTEHFTGVVRKESTSLFRAAKKIVVAKREKQPAPIIEPRSLPAAHPRNDDDAPHLELRVSRATKIASVFRHHWGDHPIFEAAINRDWADIDGPDFVGLHSPLPAYPGKLDATARLKRYLLFSRPVVKTIRHQMASDMESLGRLPGPTLVDMFQVGPADQPFLYNVIFTGTSARMTRLENRNAKDVEKANWVLAKHVLLSGYDPDVRYAGEIWVEDTDEGRVLHLNNNSGTYMPSEEQTETAGRFLSRMTSVPVICHVV